MYPKNVQAALEKHPGAVVTERGVELTHPSGTVELLVSARGLKIEEQVEIKVTKPKEEPKAEVAAEEPKPRAKPGPKPKAKVEE